MPGELPREDGIVQQEMVVEPLTYTRQQVAALDTK